MLCCGDGSCDAGLIKSLMVYYVILVLVLASAFWQGEFILVVARGCFQIGSILGPTVVQMYSTSLGIPTIYFLGACCMLILQGTIYVYIKVYGDRSFEGIESGGLPQNFLVYCKKLAAWSILPSLIWILCCIYFESIIYRCSNLFTLAHLNYF